MASENFRVVHSRVVRTYTPRPVSDGTKTQQPISEDWRRNCGCLRTSEKLKEILKTFPSAPPPSPTSQTTCLSTHGMNTCEPAKTWEAIELPEKTSRDELKPSKASSKSWQVVLELVQLVQLSVTATALALYYLVYCYMQLVYYTLRSAMYFHNADGPMKITIGVVTVTSLIVGFNLLIRVEKMLGIF